MHLHEQPDRLSRSLIWGLQKRYYANEGMQAWTSGSIPSYMSSNAYVAWSYARMADAFIRENTQSGAVTIVELGAGSGRFAYLALKALMQLSGEATEFRYIMTDFTEANLEAWRTCENFKPFLDAGVLEFAVFDADHPDVSSLGIDGSIILISNYVVDTLRQDAFRISNGQLMECRVAAATPSEKGLEETDSMQRIILHREFQPVSFPYYEDVAVNGVLSDYAGSLGDSGFILPVGFIRCLEVFRKATDGAFMALLGDKARRSLDDLKGCSDANLVLHDGCFSFTANFDALVRLEQKEGGVAMLSDDLDRGFVIAALIRGAADRQSGELKRVFEDEFHYLSPRDKWKLIKQSTAIADELDLASLISLLKLGRYETRILLGFRKAVMRAIDTADKDCLEELPLVLERVWRVHYPLGISRDVPFAIGRIYERLRMVDKALDYFEHSLDEWGEDPITFYRLARCHEKLGDFVTALDFAERGLVLRPDSNSMNDLVRRLKTSESS